MRCWRLIDSGPSDAFNNMALDEALALGAKEGATPVLRFYGWERPSVSIGCFQNAEDLDLQYLDSAGIPLVRRLTGGRGILHGNELTYSFSAPSAGVFSGGLRQCYTMLGEAFSKALRMLGLKPETSQSRRASGGSPLCFGSATLGELKLGGRKVVGSAQKRWPGGFMQQGSIPFLIDHHELSKVFKTGSNGDARDCMAGLFEESPSLAPDALKEALVAAFQEVFNIRFIESRPTPEEEALAGELGAKYRSAEWNLRRQRAMRAKA